MSKQGPRKRPPRLNPKRPGKESATMRNCMSCGNKFKSEWIGNRLCRTCAVKS